MTRKEMLVSSKLDSRRDQATTAATAAKQAQAEVTELEGRLQTNANHTTTQAQALRNAEAEISRLKRSLKAAAKEKSRLTTARKKAVSQAAKAKAKQATAESKYDKALLADLLRREKERDRTEAGQPNAAAKRTRTATPAADPPPEQPDPGTVTAVKTAARRTAARAR